MKRKKYDGQLLGVAEGTLMIGNTERSTRALIAKGIIPYVKLGGRVLFRRAELEKWIQTLPGVSLKDAELNRKARR